MSIQWEYKWLEVQSDPYHVESALNQAGLQGWEAVGVAPHTVASPNTPTRSAAQKFGVLLKRQMSA